MFFFSGKCNSQNFCFFASRNHIIFCALRATAFFFNINFAAYWENHWTKFFSKMENKLFFFTESKTKLFFFIEIKTNFFFSNKTPPPWSTNGSPLIITAMVGVFSWNLQFWKCQHAGFTHMCYTTGQNISNKQTEKQNNKNNKNLKQKFHFFNFYAFCDWLTYKISWS